MGWGSSTATEENFTIELFADDTANFMDALGVEHTHILGWSMGTQTALERFIQPIATDNSGYLTHYRD